MSKHKAVLPHGKFSESLSSIDSGSQRPKDVRSPPSVKTLERENLAKGWAI